MSPMNPFLENISENPSVEASKVLNQVGWDGSLPIDLVEIAEMFDFEVRFDPDLQARYKGKAPPAVAITFENGSKSIVINTEGSDNFEGFSHTDSLRRNQRFSLAHEIGHCIFRSHSDVDFQNSLLEGNNPYMSSYRRKYETQANQFSANLLLPENHFKQFIMSQDEMNIKNLTVIIAEEYDVSMEVSIQRLAECSNYPCMALIYKKGLAKRQSSRSEDCVELGFYIGWNTPAPHDSLAHRMSVGKTRRTYTSKRYEDSASWFPENRSSLNYKVVEHTFPLGNSGNATFLEFKET